MNNSIDILTQVSSRLESLVRHDQDKIWVGYSGGLDSTVLLHAATKLFDGCVAGIHVNHQLSSNAKYWEKHCADFADKLGIELIVERVDVDSSNKGLEAEARIARYRAYEKHIRPGEGLLLGHHQDDQAETFFLRLMRGAGIDGLSGISAQRKHKHFFIARPLLDISKTDLKDYAERHGLTWVEDESNGEEDFDRNYLRNTIIPQFAQRWPAIVAKVTHAQAWLSESKTLLDTYADEDLGLLGERAEKVGRSICLNQLQRMDWLRRKHVLRRWVACFGNNQISANQLEQVEKLIDAKRDANPEIIWGDTTFRRFQQRLYLIPKFENVSDRTISISGSVSALPNGFALTLPKSWLNQAVEVRFRSAGLRCHPVGREHSQSLKKLLQEYAVPPWLRDQVPLIYIDGSLVAVGDYFVQRGTPWSESATQLIWRHTSDGRNIET